MLEYLATPYKLHQIVKRAHWNAEKLRVYQEKELRRIVQYAFENTPFYHRRLKELRLTPADIRTLDDINKLPIIEKNDIRNNTTELISREFNASKLRALYTSGSTGKPLSVFVTKGEDVLRKLKHLRANVLCGQKPRDSWAAITSPSHSDEAPSFQKRLGIFAPSVISVFEDVKTQLSIIDKMQPDVIGGYSSSLSLIAREAEKLGIDTIKPRLIFSGAELLDPYSRRVIEKVFDAPLFDQYATIEFERIAWQCKERAQYHIDADMVITQFLDKNGEEVSPGESGQIVCTSLFSYAMPFIRYTVGDIGIPSDDVCPCGIVFPLMKVMEGRKDSILILPDGRLLSPFALAMTLSQFKFVGSIDSFRFIQKEVNRFEILLKKKDVSVDEKTIEMALINHIKTSLKVEAFDPKFEVIFLPDIPLDKNGKLSPVVSELKARVISELTSPDTDNKFQ